MIIDEKIKNVIFDLGGVLLDINPSQTINAFEKLGLTNAIDKGGWNYNHPVFLNMEEGKLSETEFRDGVRNLLPEEKSDEEINAAWCAMIIDFPKAKVELLYKLKSSFKLYLFSNTNSIHLAYFRGLFRKKFDFELDDLFHGTFYSHEMGARKPRSDSFSQVISKAGIAPQESLFIDDSKANAEGAKAVGIHSIHFNGEPSLHEIFKGYY